MLWVPGAVSIFSSFLYFFLSTFRGDLVFLCINADDVAVFHQCDQSAFVGRLWYALPPKPCVPPLNRPSVISATDFPNPAPMMAPVGFSISGIPGAPSDRYGESPPTSPAFTLPEAMPSMKSFSPSNTLAVPSNSSPSFPDILALPFFARLP